MYTQWKPVARSPKENQKDENKRTGDEKLRTEGERKNRTGSNYQMVE